jgi:opacity protein-like surface antigen
MYVKKLTLLSTVAAAAAFAASPASAAVSDMNWDMKVGDFYLAAEGGLSTDRDVKSGHYSRVTGTVANASVNQYNRHTSSPVGGRSSIGYKQMLDDMSGVSLEMGFGMYGSRELSKGANALPGASARYPVIHLDYSGVDLMLGGHYVLDRGHMLSVSVGAQRTKVDMSQRGLDSDAAKINHPAYGTRFKAGVGYEYMVKDNVGARLNYAHVFGDEVDEYQAFPGVDVIRNKPNGVPSFDTLFVGLAMYF